MAVPTVICAGSPEIAPAADLQSVFDAPQVVDRVSDSYTLDAYVWRDSQPLVITGRQAGVTELGRSTVCPLSDTLWYAAGDQPVSSSQTRLSDDSSPTMATLYLNDEACNRQTAPTITCEAAWFLQIQGSQPEVQLQQNS